MNIQIQELLTELEMDVLARNVQDVPEDMQNASLFAIRIEMEQRDPDWRYILGVLCAALQKPFASRH